MSDESRQLTMATEKTALELKFQKKMGPKRAEEFVAELENMDKEQLEARLLEYAKTHQGIINTRNSDDDLNKVKARKSSIESMYNDQLRSNKDLTRFVALIISEKFGDELMDKKVDEEDPENEEQD